MRVGAGAMCGMGFFSGVNECWTVGLVFVFLCFFFFFFFLCFFFNFIL